MAEAMDCMVSGISCANHKFMQDTINQLSCVAISQINMSKGENIGSRCFSPSLSDKEFHHQRRASSLGRHERSVRRTCDALYKATRTVP